ncbi:MAG: hypothetical protein FWH44_00525 [Methanomassiliicoccaceae archaeon]|nr:hypothetical protein [Methanomassiliicoccaceae archaeon]
MTVHLTPEQYKEKYDRIFPIMKAKGLSDRDADIVTIRKIHPTSTRPLANYYGISVDEVKKIVAENW